MAVRARLPSHPALAGALVALALTVASCSGDAPGQDEPVPPTTRRADPRLGEIADEIGCSATKPSGRSGELTGALLCAIDDETTTRIHTFEAPDRASVKRRFSEAIDDSRDGGAECNGDAYRYVVLGDDWLVATNDRVVAGNLVVNLRAELVAPAGGPPPASGVRDACR